MITCMGILKENLSKFAIDLSSSESTGGVFLVVKFQDIVLC